MRERAPLPVEVTPLPRAQGVVELFTNDAGRRILAAGEVLKSAHPEIVPGQRVVYDPDKASTLRAGGKIRMLMGAGAVKGEIREGGE